MTENVVWHPGAVDRLNRSTITGGRGLTVWLTGLSGSGKSTIASSVEALLVASERAAYTLDGDNLRHGLNADLGFSNVDRAENVRRVGEVARLMADAGFVVLVPIISPFVDGRNAVRLAHEAAGLPFVLVHVSTPLDVCEARDPKGLYAMARSGEIDNFTGISSPYEAPEDADLVLHTVGSSVEESTDAVLAVIAEVSGHHDNH